MIPSNYRSLSLVKVENTLKADIEYNQRILETIGLFPGSSIMLLNGLVIQEDDFNIYRYTNGASRSLDIKDTIFPIPVQYCNSL